MLGRLRSAVRRTLILTGLLLAAVSVTNAGELRVQGARVEGSKVYVAVANPSSQAASGTVAVVVEVSGSEVVRTATVVVAAGQSTMACMDAGANVEGVSSVGVIADNPEPF